MSAENVRERATLSSTCSECWRVFDLLDDTDAQEHAYGHDCEG
jgi:hypothetical protein